MTVRSPNSMKESPVVEVSNRWRTIVKRCVVVSLAVLILFLLLWEFPEWQVRQSGILEPKDRFEMVDRARGTWAQIIAGFAILLGLYATWRRTTAAERQAEAALEATRISQEGQVTERFTRAIEQLGSDNLAIRLGGIFALERIGRDSSKDYWIVVEVLAARLRNLGADSAVSPREPEEWLAFPFPPEDVAAIARVISRLNDIRPDGDVGFIDLSGIDLRKLDLPDANFSRCDLTYAHLEYCRFVDGDFNSSKMFYTFLQGANLKGACLECVTFMGVGLRDARLNAASLSGSIGLSARTLSQAQGDAQTRLPAEIARPEHWE